MDLFKTWLVLLLSILTLWLGQMQAPEYAWLWLYTVPILLVTSSCLIFYQIQTRLLQSQREDLERQLEVQAVQIVKLAEDCQLARQEKDEAHRKAELEQ